MFPTLVNYIFFHLGCPSRIAVLSQFCQDFGNVNCTVFIYRSSLPLIRGPIVETLISVVPLSSEFVGGLAAEDGENISVLSYGLRQEATGTFTYYYVYLILLQYFSFP